MDQNFVLPHPCDASIDLLTNPASGTGLVVEFGVLNAPTNATDITSDADSTVESSYQTKPSNVQKVAEQTLYLTYINQQNAPVSVPLQNQKFESEQVTYTASFSGNEDEINGLTIAAFTGDSDFATPEDVAAATLFAPALTEIN